MRHEKWNSQHKCQKQAFETPSDNNASSLGLESVLLRDADS